MTEISESNNQASEGGWGWIIAVVMALSLIVDRGGQHTYGMIFEELLLSMGGQTTTLVFILSANTMCFCVAGLIVSSLLKRFSCRQVGLAGALLLTTGSFLTTFANSFTYVLISYSIMQGAAMGLILPAVFTSFYQYFVKRKARVYFACKPLVGLATMGFPILINYFLDLYGNRGMLLLLSGIYGQMIVAMLLVHPVEWHMKKKNIEEINPKTINDEDAEETQHPLLDKTKTTSRKSSIRLDAVINENVDDLEQNQVNIHLTSTIKNVNVKETGKIRTIMSVINNFFDLQLLKDLSYVNLVIGTCFVEFSETSFGGILPRYLISIGWTMNDVALCLSTSGIGDFVSRIIVAALGFCVVLKGRYIFLISSIFCFIFRIAFLFVGDYISVTIIVTGIVFCKAALFSSVSLMYADHVPVKKFPAAYGLYLFSLGITMLILGPVVGAVKDYTGSYDITMYILLSCYLVCIIPWTIEIIMQKIKDKSPPT